VWPGVRRAGLPKAEPGADAGPAARAPRRLDVHDLRHTGNTLTAEAGASLAELMSRMGHSSTQAARVYLHARDERDQQLAAMFDKLARRELKRSASARNKNRSGT